MEHRFFFDFSRFISTYRLHVLFNECPVSYIMIRLKLFFHFPSDFFPFPQYITVKSTDLPLKNKQTNKKNPLFWLAVSKQECFYGLDDKCNHCHQQCMSNTPLISVQHQIFIMTYTQKTKRRVPHTHLPLGVPIDKQPGFLINIHIM